MFLNQWNGMNQKMKNKTGLILLLIFLNIVLIGAPIALFIVNFGIMYWVVGLIYGLISSVIVTGVAIVLALLVNRKRGIK